MSHHQIAKPVVAVIAVEIKNERAASLIQSVTALAISSRRNCHVQLWLNMWRMSGIEVAIFIAVAYEDRSHTGGRSRSIKFHSSPNDQNCSINLKR